MTQIKIPKYESVVLELNDIFSKHNFDPLDIAEFTEYLTKRIEEPLT